MKRKHTLVVGVLLIVSLGGIAVLHSRPHRALPASAGAIARSSTAQAGASLSTSPVAVQHPPAPTRATIAADPIRTAHAWMARSNAVVTAKNVSLFGADAAHLMILPPAEAWSALTARAKNGDTGAAAAALLLANDCKNLSEQATLFAASHSRFVDHMTSGLPHDWERFLHTIDAQQQERLQARIASCADVGGIWDFALLVLNRFMQPDDPGMQLAEAGDIRDDATAIADLRQLADQTDSEGAKRALGMRLIESKEAANQAEGLALLEQLATGDADIVSFLAGCFQQGCGAFRGDPGVADAWVERAARLGEWGMLSTYITKLQTAGQPVDAWAWALYRLDLASAGCFEMGEPQLAYIAQSAQDAFRLEQMLGAAQQAAGRAAAAAIAAQSWATATARLDCGG